MENRNECVICLNNGTEMPRLGFGVFQITDGKECRESVLTALQTGYRLIDTAACYGNERAVGEAVRESGISRQEVFLTSKVWIQDAGYEKTKLSFQKTLENLGTDYLDLYLIHMPYGDYYGSWRAMEELYREGKVRAIGLSNFLPHHIENILAHCTVAPMADQLEYHPGYSQEAAVRYCQDHGILVQAWSPLGRTRVLEDPMILSLAEKYGVSPAKICLGFALQRGVQPLPKASSQERMRENLDLGSFEMEQEDIWRLATMPQTGWSGEHPDRVRVRYEDMR